MIIPPWEVPQTPQDDAPPPPLGKSSRPLRMIFPLESRWDLSEWVPPWEVPHTSQNDFPLGKALRPLGMSFPLGSPLDLSEWFSPWEVPQTPQNKEGDAPFHN